MHKMLELILEKTRVVQIATDKGYKTENDGRRIKFVKKDIEAGISYNPARAILVLSLSSIKLLKISLENKGANSMRLNYNERTGRQIFQISTQYSEVEEKFRALLSYDPYNEHPCGDFF